MNDKLRVYGLSLLLLLLLTSCGRTGGEEKRDRRTPPEEERILTEQVNKICRTQPEEALRMLDEAEEAHTMRSVKVNLLKAMTYVDGYYDLNKGLEYAMKAYYDPAVRNDTLPRISITRMLTALNYALSRFSQACAMATEGSALAYAVGDQDAIAYFYQYIAFTQYELGDHEEAFRYFDRSIQLYKEVIEKEPHWVHVSDMLDVQMMEIQDLHDEGRYQEALAKMGDCEETLKRLTTFPDLADGLHDKKTAQYLSIASCVYHHTGQKAKAEEAYRTMTATEYVKCDMGQNVPAPYEVLSGRYREALQRTMKEEAAYEAMDTVNTPYIREVLSNGLAACQGLGDYQRANGYMQRILNLKDSIYLRNQRQTALEMAEIYETRDKDIQLVEKDAQLLRHRLLLIMAVSIALLSLLALALILWYNRIIQRKNRAVVRGIEEKLRLMQMADASRTENKEDAVGQDLFNRIDRTIRENQLFLQQDFSRDMLCEQMNISRTLCSSLIKTYAQCTFPAYINRLRLNHAIELMKLHPNYSIEAIANECGMERANFHRRFAEEFGITPSEFKKTKIEVS